MQTILTLLFLAVLLFLQGSSHLFSSFDFLLPLVIAISVKQPQNEALIYSFCGGFLQDALFSIGFINTLVKTLIGVLISYLKTVVVLEEDRLCVLFALIFTPISIVGSVAAVQFFGNTERISIPWLNLIISTILNVILAPLFYSILNRIYSDER